MGFLVAECPTLCIFKLPYVCLNSRTHTRARARTHTHTHTTNNQTLFEEQCIILV